MDSKMHPARGQIVVVRNDPGPMASVSGTDDGETECLYIMTRAAGMSIRPFDLRNELTK
jgi:D-amino-acid oxidase